MTFNEQIDKIKKVFNSCETKEQLTTAYNWCNMFNSENNIRYDNLLDPSWRDISDYIEEMYLFVLAKIIKGVL